MAANSFFYSSAYAVSTVIKEEKLLSIYSGIDFLDKVLNIRVNNLNMKVTSHRIIFSNHDNIDKVKATDNNFLYFLVRHSSLSNIEKKFKGVILKTLSHIKLDVKQGAQTQCVEIHSKSLEGPYLQIEAGFSRKEWKIETIITEEQQQQVGSGAYEGARLELLKKQEKVKTTQTTIQSSFNKDNMDDLFKNASELQQITKYLKENIKSGNQQEQGDVNQILEQMGCFQIITKDEAGDSYYSELSKQLYTICQKLFETMGGIVPLIDLYYAINKKRGTSLVAPDEILQACFYFQRLGFKAKISTYLGNIKVVESTELNPEQDFEGRLGKALSYDRGRSYEEILKTLKYPPLVLRIKLKVISIDMGKVVVDNRLEGVRYYRNLIMNL